MSKPDAAADLAGKLASLAREDRGVGFVMVRWWKPLNDPALIGLGGGVVTISVGQFERLDDTALSLRKSDRLAAAIEQPAETDAIPRADILDLSILGYGTVSDADLRRLAGVAK